MALEFTIEKKDMTSRQYGVGKHSKSPFVMAKSGHWISLADGRIEEPEDGGVEFVPLGTQISFIVTE